MYLGFVKFFILLTLNSGFFLMNVSIFANHYFNFFNLSDRVKTNDLISYLYLKKYFISITYL